jgi:hypothetical protein
VALDRLPSATAAASVQGRCHRPRVMPSIEYQQQVGAVLRRPRGCSGSIQWWQASIRRRCPQFDRADARFGGDKIRFSGDGLDFGRRTPTTRSGRSGSASTTKWSTDVSAGLSSVGRCCPLRRSCPSPVAARAVVLYRLRGLRRVEGEELMVATQKGRIHGGEAG